MPTMRVPLFAQAFLDGFTFGGLLSKGRPHSPTSIFPERDHDGSEADPECDREPDPVFDSKRIEDPSGS
jgi:hypothetical protein